MTPKYSLVIRWSEEDHCFVAWVPEFGPGAKTHGCTYEEAARAGQEIIELLSETPTRSQEKLPEPWLFTGIEPDELLGRQLFPSNGAYDAPGTQAPKQVKHVTARS